LKLLAVVGTRPEAIKMAPVIQALRARRGVECRVVTTAQHRQMTDEVMALFGIAFDHDLDVMSADQTPSAVAAAVLARLPSVLERERPDWVLVQGDTTTVVASALAAFYGGWKVAHVEAGLRTRDRRQPFPEEVNRRLTAVVADLHFAPTETARRNRGATCSRTACPRRRWWSRAIPSSTPCSRWRRRPRTSATSPVPSRAAGSSW
jgi:UDP-N-acetylglucosamine 2-epimerase (non-hydrolysing)